MRPELHDLRILKLAEMYEMAYETFVLDAARNLLTGELARQALDELAQGRHAERIGHEIQRLNASLDPDDRVDVVRAALMDLVEIEGAARDFFRTRADQVHDGRVAALFRALAEEESRHVAVARRLLASVEGDRRSGLDGPDAFRVAGFLLSQERADPATADPRIASDPSGGP